MIDMHAHICSYENTKIAEEELTFRKEAGICTFFSTGTPEEYRFLAPLVSDPFSITFGIHPWYADQWDPGDWMEDYRSCPIIGEIGMDQLWCEVPLARQQKVLEKQLEIAADLKKPIVLHTKDCEARIAQMIRDFPYPVLVHWYSGDPASLYSLIHLGCFFTLGPDTGALCSSDTGHMVLQNVPKDRLFPETDGLGAILWACGNKTSDSSLSLIKESLDHTTLCYAHQFSLSKEAALTQIRKNLSAYLNQAKCQ